MYLHLERALSSVEKKEQREKFAARFHAQGGLERKIGIMYTNPFNRKHSTIRQMLDRLLDPTKKPIRRSESVCSSSSNDSSKGNHGSFGRYYTLTHSHRVTHVSRGTFPPCGLPAAEVLLVERLIEGRSNAESDLAHELNFAHKAWLPAAIRRVSTHASNAAIREEEESED
ncbi:hypothetical protein DBV15_09784 [Temnothorax longispinosus]|uniref:Uncharacterized protein n=1 Tax=Temnothorax longispinosus TaxID=300112 RepID=A0A4S2JW44_9HYME|nr:hypothetical protein DBV15_09784 [Temnothorax longispinosus]